MENGIKKGKIEISSHWVRLKHLCEVIPYEKKILTDKDHSHFSSYMISIFIQLPYFFSYKMEFFSFQNNPKNLDPSYKTDLVLKHYFGRVKLVL